MSLLHPSLPLLAAAALQGLVGERWRGPLALAGALGGALAVLMLPEAASFELTLIGFELEIVRTDALARVFALVFAALAVLGTLYALHVRKAGEHAAALVYAAASLGVVLAGDWRSLFLFWELMAIASAAVVWFGGAGARAAGLRYLLVHVASGAFLFAGVLLLSAEGALAVGPLAGGPAFWLVLAAVGINAAIPPLHAWLTDAYPEASVTGSVFLSGFTTKAAVYVLLRAFPGVELLAWAGVAMALYGVVFAVLENDIRRLLAYHIVSQVGYMVVGVGMGTTLALDGAAAHAFCHILYKALLFMGAGAVLQATGRRKLSELGGIAPQLKAVVALYMVGAFSISGAPMLNGFVSKSLVVSAAAEGGWPVFELLLTLASVGTFLHTGLKLPYFTFFGPARGLVAAPLPRNMLAAMGAAAALCALVGIFPGWLYARLPFQTDYHAYTVDHVVSSVQLLLGTAVAFVVYLGKLGGEATLSLDSDWFYRRPLAQATFALVSGARQTGAAFEAAGGRLVARLASVAWNPFRAFGGLGRLLQGEVAIEEPREPAYDPDLHRFPIGVTVFWVLAALALTSWLLMS